jgi:oxaloacetate decarboxylase alpha subunit
VSGQDYVVKVSEGGDVTHLAPVGTPSPSTTVAPSAPLGEEDPVMAPLAGTIMRVLVTQGQVVQEGNVLLTLEAMKMETEIRAARAGTVASLKVAVGDSVAVGQTLLTIA